MLGQRLRRDGRRIEAREQLRAAAEGFRRLGARPWVEAAERELGATGERLRRRAPGAPEELTTQERVIAELVAAGASNKDVAGAVFLSAKTVEAHLTRIYRKLGVNSRTQLGRRLDEERSAAPVDKLHPCPRSPCSCTRSATRWPPTCPARWRGSPGSA